MATAKDKLANMNTAPTYSSTVAAALKRPAADGKKAYSPQPAADPAEVAERTAAMRTQGRKGCKEQRINMAFTPDNYDYIKTMAAATGLTMTEFTNKIIASYKDEHSEYYDMAKQMRENL